MKTFLTNLTTRHWLLLAGVGVVAAYPLVHLVVPAVVHALVPEVVRSVWHVI